MGYRLLETKTAVDELRQWRILQHVEFIETPVFTKRAEKLLSEEEFRRLQISLALVPEQGIRLAGNLRKIRWAAKGKGKSGDVRIIYALISDDLIYLLFIFPKNEQENLTKEQLDLLRKLADQELS